MFIDSWKVTGFKELDKALEELTEPKFRKAALRRSGRKAMQPVLRDAKANAPLLKDIKKNPNVKKGELKSDITMGSRVNVDPKISKRGKLTKSSKHELTVWVKTGSRSEDYALVVEYGREEFIVMRNIVFGREVKPFWAPVAALDPNPFMRPALDSNVDDVIKTFAKEMEKEIAIQAKKQRRRRGLK